MRHLQKSMSPLTHTYNRLNERKNLPVVAWNAKLALHELCINFKFFWTERLILKRSNLPRFLARILGYLSSTRKVRLLFQNLLLVDWKQKSILFQEKDYIILQNIEILLWHIPIRFSASKLFIWNADVRKKANEDCNFMWFICH